MKITRETYEPFFMDYLDGKLEERGIDQFLDFLEQNPDLKEELQLFETLSIPPEPVVFNSKQQLYKSNTDTNTAAGHQLVSYFENDLENEQRESFEAWLSTSPELQKEYSLLSKTRLVADAGIHYPDKQKLYKKAGPVIALTWAYRAAAVLVLLWGINTLWPSVNEPSLPVTQDQLVQNQPPTNTPVKQPVAAVKDTPAAPGQLSPSPGKSQKRMANHVRPVVGSKKEEAVQETRAIIGRDLSTLAELLPRGARLADDPADVQLAVRYDVPGSEQNNSSEIMDLDEFLAYKAKKLGDEGLLSAQRFVRAGLDLASELSGDRIGFSTKEGKISSLNFDSKLLAFSIPIRNN